MEVKCFLVVMVLVVTILASVLSLESMDFSNRDQPATVIDNSEVDIQHIYDDQGKLTVTTIILAQVGYEVDKPVGMDRCFVRNNADVLTTDCYKRIDLPAIPLPEDVRKACKGKDIWLLAPVSCNGTGHGPTDNEPDTDNFADLHTPIEDDVSGTIEVKLTRSRRHATDITHVVIEGEEDLGCETAPNTVCRWTKTESSPCIERKCCRRYFFRLCRKRCCKAHRTQIIWIQECINGHLQPILTQTAAVTEAPAADLS